MTKKQIICDQDITGIGMTAFLVSVVRAMETQRENSLFEDEFAKCFVNEVVLEKLKPIFSLLSSIYEKYPYGNKFLPVRVKFFEDKIVDYINHGGKQIVLLGGGFDMRACKFASESVRFFDVDQESVLNYKKHIINQHAIEYPASFVCCDYVKDDFIGQLGQSGFDLSLPSLFIWEGNTMYLPNNQIVYDLLSDIQSNVENVTICFDYFKSEIFKDSVSFPIFSTFRDLMMSIGVPWVNGFNSSNSFIENTSLNLIDQQSMGTLLNGYYPDSCVKEKELAEMECLLIGTFSNFK